MAKNNTFSVNKAGGTGVVAQWMQPDSIDDKEWQKRIAGDHSETVTLTVSKAVAAGLLDLATQQFVVKCQGAARAGLPNKAEVQARVDKYCYGARPTATVVRPKIDAKEAKLSLAQCIALEAAGVEIVNRPEK